MSVLKKPYELSLWRDVWNGSKFEEKRFMTIGSDTMNTPLRAMNVQLKRGINGSNDLTFKMYYRCQDTVTGEWLNNPWTDELVNETKLKLHYKNKWYDFIIKDIKEDSSNKSYTYSAIDQHIQELSKNGYDVELDAELMNNTGTATELAKSILSGTDWEVDGEVIPQLTEETVIKMVLSKDIACYRLNEETGKPFEVEEATIKESETIYAFYSCCSGAQYRFSFIYLGENAAKVDANGVLTNKNCQYYLDMPNDSYSMGEHGYFVPTFATDNNIHREFRAKKYTFSQKIQYHPVLDKYVYSYSDGETDTEYLGYAETKYITPVLAKNLVTNSLFKSTAGWHGEYIGGDANDKDNSAAKVSVTAKNAAGAELIDKLTNGTFDATETYEPILRLEFQKNNSVVTNSGFYDHRFDIKNLVPGQKFVLLWNGRNNSTVDNFSVGVGVKEYNVSGSQYYNDSNNQEDPGSLNKTFLHFDEESEVIYEILDENATEEEINKRRSWQYRIGTVSNEYNLTEAVFQKKQTRIFITATEKTTLEFTDFQIIPYIATGNEEHPFLLPDEAPDLNTTSETTYRIFDKALNEKVKDPKEFDYIYEGKVLPTVYKPFYTEKAEKVTSLSVKQSNYFNSIQSLCETFECWADFQVEHDSEGYITSKKVYIKNYISKNNYAGLRAGVNLKQTSRGRDSKQIVTKLIVPANSNEHGEDGFCTIARSDYNETGENCIYNFEYYIRQGLLNRDVLYDYFYGANDKEGYYSVLKRYNKNLQALTQEIAVVSTSLVQIKSDLSAAEVGREQSLELLNDAADQFQKLTGFSYDAIVEDDQEKLKAMAESSAKVLELLTQISEYRTAYYTYDNQYAKVYALHDRYQKHYNDLLEKFTTTTNEKKERVKEFYGLYGRFLLEGTWKDEKQMDDNLYYLDALSTSNNSNFPQVTYQFSVLDVSILPNYEYYDFELGDKTYAEDTEFFGYNKDGTPYREEVVISEVTYNLDDPTANSFQVRNFKNQFQDLFQKITATVQNVSYASGSYDRAASFIEAAADKQAQFLQAAMQDADLILKNAGQQSVTWGTDGITVTDVDTPSEQVRIVGGAIMLRDPDYGAGERWITAITAKGINAKVITAGRIDTQLVQIMNGTQPAFRWDFNGITAFDTVFMNQNTVINNCYNPTAGVRFDRFGVYSFRGVNGDTWAPTSVDEILEYAGFALTNEGFVLNQGNINKGSSYTKTRNSDKTINDITPLKHYSNFLIGKTEDFIYNAWDNDGYPYYDQNNEQTKFVKVMSISSGSDSQPVFALYDDGTLVTKNIRITEGISYAEGVSFIKYIYHPATDSAAPPTLPSNGTPPDKVNEQYPNWSTEFDADSVYYATTANNGANWAGPFQLSGRTIIGQVIKYHQDYSNFKYTESDKDDWKNSIEDLKPLQPGLCVYVATQDIYSSGEKSNWRYSVSYNGTNGKHGQNGTSAVDYKIVCTPSTLKVGEDGKATEEIVIQVFRILGATQQFVQHETIECLYFTKNNSTSPTITEVLTLNSLGIATTNQLTQGVYEKIVINYTKDYRVLESETVIPLADGADGAPGISYKLISPCGTVGVDTNGDPLVTSLTFKAVKISETGVEDWTEAYYQFTAGQITSNNYIKVSEQGTFEIDELTKTEYPLKVQLYAKVGGKYILVDEDIIYLNTVGPPGAPGAEGTHGTSSTPITVYCTTGSTSPAYPTSRRERIVDGEIVVDYGAGTNYYWYESSTAESMGQNYPYKFICKGQKVTTYDINNQPTISYNWGIVELYDAVIVNGQETISTSKSYVEFLKLTDFGTKSGLEYGTDGKLYVNAEFIKSGALLVGDSESSALFYADIDKGKVTIGGWTVTGYSLKSGDENTFIKFNGKPGDRDLWIEATNGTNYFRVNTSGVVIAKGADIEGTITATSGYIGDIQIVNGGIQAANFSISKTGILKATNADISGTISANKGDIGGIKIGSDGIYASTATIPRPVSEPRGLVLQGEGSANKWNDQGVTITSGTGSTYYNYVYSVPSGTNVTIKPISDQSTRFEVYVFSEKPNFKDKTYNTDITCYYYYVVSEGKNRSEFTITNKANSTVFLVINQPKSTKLVNVTSVAFNIDAEGLISGKELRILDEAQLLNFSLRSWEGSQGNEGLGTILTTMDISDLEDLNSMPSESGLALFGSQHGGGILMSNSQDSTFKGFGVLDTFTLTFSNGSKDFQIMGPHGTTANSASASLIYHEKPVLTISSTSSATQVATAGTWTGSVSGSSDYRLKKEITSLQDSYSQFFDNLRPVRFKFYNPSNFQDTYRCGFIAQEVVQALGWAGLTKEEWGGLTTFMQDEDEYYALIYTEFIALNTQQIQLLKPRMTAAEQKIAELETEVAELRTIVSNLTIS